MATLLGSRTTGLRCLAQLSPDGLVFTPRRANFVTSTGGPFQQLSIGSRTSDFFPARPSPSQRSKGSPIPTRRPYATTSSTPTTPSSPAPSASAAAELTWNRFFDLRRKRRYINTGASVICALAALGVGGPIIAQQDLDTWGAQISGIDPIFVFGGSSFAVAVAGWLCGPAFGGALFGAWAGRRGWAGIIAEVSHYRSPFRAMRTDEADEITHDRRRRASSAGSSGTAQIHRAAARRTPSLTITARRSAAWRITGGG